MEFQTEFNFTLPKGYMDSSGVLHKEGMMRLANAGDEIIPLRDPRVMQNPSYLGIIILSRVITRLGRLNHVDTITIEKLYKADMAYLQDFYERINSMENPSYECTCPSCGRTVEVAINFSEAP